ncbi:hypothetical protein BDV37DRAFT_241090 [Aspergillus pseudonomiae]|uniref:Uncharacterized protein n=1 Tax=Aspergillus pseudonomiae TaxID=1506151 RepID=A0A5N7DNU5_9EURO|nr:uncharacterized protein BDV37DRAFT_241090 [Aspergillus pseudonomiae]KAE8407148.1 hypothetical protein BDV37DRAFT_241090 [Aspergillus pseudonomiae]
MLLFLPNYCKAGASVVPLLYLIPMFADHVVAHTFLHYRLVRSCGRMENLPDSSKLWRVAT